MRIEPKHLDTFRKIIDDYKHSTAFPQKDNWKYNSNNELWLRLVGEVSAVGGSSGSKRFSESSDYQNRVSLDKLSHLDNDDLAETINSVLREAGVRYVSKKNISKISVKAKCLAKNYQFISKYPKGFIGILEYLIENYQDDAAELNRAYFLKDNLKFISHKTARDLLMDLGINFHTIALDSRIQAIFSYVGISIPEKYDTKTYEETERAIVNEICIPINILPVHFDRILYRNYKQILPRKISQKIEKTFEL